MTSTKTATASPAIPAAPASRDNPRPRISRSSSWAIELRLVAAFVAVAVVAVILVAALAVGFGEKDLSTLAQQRRDDLTQSLLADALSTYDTGVPGWSDVDLAPAMRLAASTGTNAAILDVHGRVVATTPGGLAARQGARRFPIVQHGAFLGALVLQFTGRGLAASADHLRTSLLRAVLGAVGLAAALALMVALATSRRITRPLHRLIETIVEMGRGNRRVRVGVLEAPGQLGALAATFDSMADALAREEQVRRDLVADAAHELRTPVAIVQASCEALLDGIVAPTAGQIESLHEEAVRVGAMVDDLQTLAATDAAVLHLSPDRCDLGEIAAEAVHAFHPRFRTAGVTLTAETTETPMVGDPARLRQVIGNLLSNALKFTGPGGDVHVRVRPVDGTARLSIADSGIGVALDEQPHVFERFRRGRQARDVPGSGIGLAVVAELVHAHDGQVTLRSEPGHGTTVSLRFPSGT